LPPDDEPPVLAGGADDVDLVVSLAVVVGLLPPSETISGCLVVVWEEEAKRYRYQAGIASSTGSERCKYNQRRRKTSRSSPVHHIVRMLGSELQRR